ncbi:MAG TPA: VWA domain-containing protein [Vicinamibacteria bacterium]|nr:VWA domain-containing protein [Vicinamibacteria bacterium]
MTAALAALGWALAVAQAPPAPPPVFASSVEYVYVDVFVTQGGRSIPGLHEPDFELKDDGVLQSPELVSAESRPVEAALVFDTSGSVAGERLAALRSAGAAFLDGLGAKDEASLFAFCEEISWRARPTADKAVVRASLAGVGAAGATSAYDALYAALALADPQMPSLIALFTDGEDNMSILSSDGVRQVAERSNSLVHVVSAAAPAEATGRHTARILREIAEHSGGRFWNARTSKDLRAAFGAIAASIGERYVLRYQAQGVKRAGWHPLAVKLRSAKGTVRARRGYWVAEGRD